MMTLVTPLVLLIATGGRFALGMAKPVPVNFAKLIFPRTGMMLVALGGPAANILLAVFFTFLLQTFALIPFLYAAYFNLGLALFNLLPIPPLDGSKILAGMLPAPWASNLLKNETWGYLLIVLLYFSGMLFSILVPGINMMCRALNLPMLEINR